MSWLWKCLCVSVWCQWSKTFLRRWNPDDVVGQRRSFSHAVSNVVNCSIPLDVRMGCHSINVDVVAHVNLDRYQTCFTGLGNKRICSTWAEKLCRDLFFRNNSYLLQCLQSFSVHFCDVVGFCDRIKILANWVNIHQAVVCDLDTLEVREKPANKKRLRIWAFTAISLRKRHDFSCSLPGENVFAGVGVGERAELSDHHTLLCDCSHVCICSDKPAGKIKRYLKNKLYKMTESLL